MAGYRILLERIGY